MKLNKEQLKFIENRSDLNGQWKHSWPVFEEFNLFLRKKKLKPVTIGKKTNCVILFLMSYLRENKNIKSFNDISEKEISLFMTYYYYSLFPESTSAEKEKFKKAVIDFYTFLYKKNLISKEKYMEISG